ncbi:hypothetical protein M405DRAFT_847902 [Rhizopogon salebrosus TDB-379]|nr:hypothetical protein M405DRAFT_847902 [Rhizopogon salebrosus TDB-379]
MPSISITILTLSLEVSSERRLASESTISATFLTPMVPRPSPVLSHIPNVDGHGAMTSCSQPVRDLISIAYPDADGAMILSHSQFVCDFILLAFPTLMVLWPCPALGHIPDADGTTATSRSQDDAVGGE